MTKTILKFTKASGRYNAGDVAGFDLVTAGRLKAKGVAKDHVAESATSVLALSVDSGAVQAALEEAQRYVKGEEARLHTLADGIQQRERDRNAELDARSSALDTRQTELDQRQRDLDDREAALGAGTGTANTGEAAGAAPAGADAAKTVDPDALPTQGKAKAK